MKKQSVSNLQRRMAFLGILGLAAGIGYAGVRAQRKAQGKRWQDHLKRSTTYTALVTGASAGIGKAFAEQLAQMGYHLVLVARRMERLDTQATEYQSSYGICAEALRADLSTDDGIAKVEQRLSSGDIDLVVNNAGYDVFGDFAQIPIEQNLALLNCLELATVRLTRAALPAMLKHRRGAVINVSSIGAFGPKRKDAMYVSAKAFVNRFTESLALELRDSGVRVQALCPGFTLTEFHDAPEYAPYHIKERIPAWLWMQPAQVVKESLQALGEDRVICVPGVKNQAVVFAAQSGLSRLLMRLLAGFFPAGQREGSGSPPPSQSLYRNFAPFYDLLFNTTYAGARRQAVDLLGLQPGERLLISGVGTGLDLPQIPAGVDVTGVDISSEMLLEASRKTSQVSVNLIKMDAQGLDFPEGYFDAALLNLIVSVAPDGRAVFQEAWRVLKPGGRLVLFDKFLPEGQSISLPRSILGALFRWIGTDINRKLSDIVGNSVHRLVEVDEPSLFWGQYRILRYKKVIS